MLAWLAGSGEGWAENALGPNAHGPLAVLAFMLTIAASLGIMVGSVFLMPAVTALVASFFVDDIALEVERSRYPGEPEGKPLPLLRAVIEGVKTALLAIAVYLVALPFLLFAGFGALIFFFCTAYILGREYFELAAMRYRPVAEARALRKRHSGTVFMAGTVHRRLRVDPDRQSGDPAVRHGLHGAHAQAPVEAHPRRIETELAGAA